MNNVKLHLGAGAHIKEGWVNLDNRKLPGIDVVCDVLDGLPFEDSSVDMIFSCNFLEHIPQEKVVWFMNEMWRVMKPGGTMHHIVPLAGTNSYWQDPTHVSHWIHATVKYFLDGHDLWKIYSDYIKPWKLVKNHTSPLHSELFEFILEK